MSAHTPGPWTVTDNSWEVSSVYASGTVLAEVLIHSDCDEDTQDRYEPEKEANARLIAAAPELLAALENLLIACPDETFQDGARLRQEQVARLNGTILMAKSAITKARGES